MRPTDAERSELIINGTHISQAVTGPTPDDAAGVIVLLHGWGADLTLVWPLATELAKRGYTCYTLDLPGFGASETPAQPWTAYDYVALVLAYMDAQNIGQAHIFGHSFGGRLGLLLGSDHAGRVQKMVLSNSAGIRTQADRLTRWRQRAYKTARSTLHYAGAHKLADSLQAAYSARYGSADYQQASAVMRATLVNVVNLDLSEQATRVQVPTLLFWGDLDDATPLWQGQKLEKLIPDAGLVVHEGAGHYSYLDRLSKTVQVTDHFLRH
jgi:pimeloyl-ACP methyl ester carboxylesterase